MEEDDPPEFPEGWWGRVDGARHDAPRHLMVHSEDYWARESACRGRRSDGYAEPGRQIPDEKKCGTCVEMIILGEFPGVSYPGPKV